MIIENVLATVRRTVDKLRPQGPSHKNYVKGEITNETLYDELIEHFKTQMDKLSLKRRVLYPMSFNILLYPDDYKKVGESLPFILPEVIAGFYEAIQKKSRGIKDVCYEPPATYWFFQFAASEIKTVEGKDSFIKPGEIVTIGNLTTFDIRNAQKAIIEQSTLLSIKCQNSNVNQNNINKDALVGMEILTNNAYCFNFDKNMSQSLSDIQSSQRNSGNALATISYTTKDNSIAKLSMMDDLIILSGSAETRKSGNILKIDHEAVQIGHVQIRYNKETNRFQLCAYAQTRLNQRNVPLSTGGTPLWVDMSYNSDIFLNDEVNIKFKASESIIAQIK